MALIDSINVEYTHLKFPLYKVEVGVLWNEDEKMEDYDCYNKVYDKRYGYFDENVAFELDYSQALNYAKQYVENGVNGTYAIISKIDFDNEYYKFDMEDTLIMINTILGGSYIDEYNDLFTKEDLYGTNNIVYSARKQKDKENPYFLGKGNGKIIENFVGKEML